MSLTSGVVQKNILINETQLGEQLNECIHSDRRSDFSLMLAMLTDDVLAHSQFYQPETKITEKVISDTLLRKSFQLPKVAPLAVDKTGSLSIYNQAEHIETNQLSEIRLQSAINPVPLAFRDDAKYIPTNVLDNTSVYCQLKHNKKQDNDDGSTLNRLSFNAKAWLDNIQTSLVKSPLLSA
jgi:hypothetical protein